MKEKRKGNKNIESLYNDIINVLDALAEDGIAYYYNRPCKKYEGDITLITWPNHTPGRENSGKAFITLAQYRYILEQCAFHCILFDGSLMRTSFKFSNTGLMNHSHLWWPAPYTVPPHEEMFIGYDATGQSQGFLNPYWDFITSPNWMNCIGMRSPIRIDYDVKANVSQNHPLTHMHIQNPQTRINVSRPICFSEFVNFVITTFYPEQKWKYEVPQFPFLSHIFSDDSLYSFKIS